jgi:thiamine biosynthesis lipoprotein
VGIAPLELQEKPKRSILLANGAVSTSGDAEQYVEIDGKRYSHIVDPKTGIGILGQFSVTVTARRGIDCDALDTAIAVMGPEKGMRLIESLDDMAALFIRKVDGKEQEIRSKRFREK